MTCHHLPMPERVPATTTKVHSWGSRLFGLMVLPMGAGAVIMGMLERQDVAHGQDALPGVLALGSLAVLAGRALRLGISINDDELTTRGWLRTRRFRRSAITRVDGRGYSGFYNRSSSSRTFTMREDGYRPQRGETRVADASADRRGRAVDGEATQGVGVLGNPSRGCGDRLVGQGPLGR
jgi:hypothetical protein